MMMLYYLSVGYPNSEMEVRGQDPGLILAGFVVSLLLARDAAPAVPDWKPKVSRLSLY